MTLAEGRIEGTAYEVAGPEHGAGPPVVLVHGLGMTRAMWDWQWPALTARFRVLRYDLLGHGASAKPPGPYSLGRFADQVAGLMDHLRWDSAALVGFSLGGMIVRAFALAYPARVSALAVLNSAHARSEAERDAVRRRVAIAEAGGPAATVDEALARWFTADFAARHPEVLERVRGWILANDPAVYPLSYRVLAEGDLELAEAVSAIACPTLVMTGTEDRGNSPDMARRLAALIPGAELAILPGLRHMGLAEDPEAYNRRLVEFLARSAS
ncbi:MAG: alpha/beta fold hydrolase [Kiloniellales bacterium]|nr:alpha/beta fold hydrolase [Kiloniellales bacterium]